MAAEPPPASSPPPPPSGTPAVGPTKGGCFGRGCGLSCGGCLVAMVLVVLLVVGGGWWFFVIQASAAVTAPATLVVISQPITVDGSPATAGQSLEAGRTVATGPAAHGAIDFPDGSYMKLGPQTSVQVTDVHLQKNGNLQAIALEPVVPIARDPQDPFAQAAQCAAAVSSGTTAGTAQISTGDAISTGQTAQIDYSSPGGTVSVALCYPGSFMTLSLFDPSGTEHASRNGASPVTGKVSGPAGLWRAIVHGIDVPVAEAFAVAFATDAPCSTDNVDNGTAVRETLSNSEIAKALADSGSTGVSLSVQGTSPSGARVVYSSDLGGVPISWTIDFYAATPDLGAVITQVTVRGVNVTTQVIKNLSSYGGQTISTIPSGFTVDRLYSCASAGGDNLLVFA